MHTNRTHTHTDIHNTPNPTYTGPYITTQHDTEQQRPHTQTHTIPHNYHNDDTWYTNHMTFTTSLATSTQGTAPLQRRGAGDPRNNDCHTMDKEATNAYPVHAGTGQGDR